MVTRSNHVRLLSSNSGQFVIILVQQTLIHLSTIRYGGVRKETLDLLLKPVVGVRDVTS
jgi:hypothetical protein